MFFRLEKFCNAKVRKIQPAPSVSPIKKCDKIQFCLKMPLPPSFLCILESIFAQVHTAK